MKIIKIVTHPITLILSFLVIIISGQHLGGFYLLYILFGLTSGTIHSILALAGIGLLLFGSFKYRGNYTIWIEPLLNIVGAILLVLSIFLFFYNDKGQYNYGTFNQTIPVITIILFALIFLIFSVYNILKLLRPNRGAISVAI